MRYETVQKLRDKDFKRSTGVQRSTFEKMLEVVTVGLGDFGRPTKLSRADQLLLTLMYWREYRTEFHNDQESRKRPDPVKAISPSGQKALQPSDTVIEIVLIDATEQPIERPKKDSTGITAVKGAPHPKSTVDG